MHKTRTSTLIKALRIIADDIKTEEGLYEAAIYEAAERLEELSVYEQNVKIGEEQ